MSTTTESPTTELVATPRTLRTHEIPLALSDLLDEIEDAGGEITPEQEAALIALEADFDARAERIWKATKLRLADAEYCREEAKRLSARASAIENGAKRTKEWLLRQFEAMGKEKVKTKTLSLWTQASPPSVKLSIDPVELPDDLRVDVYTAKAKTEAILAKWKADPESLPEGVSVTQGRHLTGR